MQGKGWMDAYFILQSSGLNHFQRSSINFNEAIPSLAVGNSRCSFLKIQTCINTAFYFCTSSRNFNFILTIEQS